ncbi:hypothetical protein HK102_006777 [Quaeritorhiza haematococci]|nr:hypothetical protein HK102_006777 [Quaeritorhiza haematococci]
MSAPVDTTDVFKPDILAGKVAFVTGGGSGICKGMTEALMRHGAKAIITSRKLDKLQVAARELQDKTGRECLAIQADVRNYKDLEEAMKVTIERFGRIDILVCGAAGNFLAPIEGLSPNAFKTVIDIDLIGTYNTIKAAVPYLKESKGTIINVSATLHYTGTPYQAHPSAAKAGVDALTRVVANELGPHGIRCNVIAPGPISDTEGMARLAPPGTEKLLESIIPLQRYGRIKDIAYMAVFLASEAGNWITGGIFVVDGGDWMKSSGMMNMAYKKLIPKL